MAEASRHHFGCSSRCERRSTLLLHDDEQQQRKYTFYIQMLVATVVVIMLDPKYVTVLAREPAMTDSSN